MRARLILPSGDQAAKTMDSENSRKKSQLFTIRLHENHDSAIISGYLNNQAKGPPSPMRIFLPPKTHTTRNAARRAAFLVEDSANASCRRQTYFPWESRLICNKMTAILFGGPSADFCNAQRCKSTAFLIHLPCQTGGPGIK